MTYRYRSPLRPLDIGWTARQAGVEVDLDNTTFGPFYAETIKTRIYAFWAPLPQSVVDQHELVEVHEA